MDHAAHIKQEIINFLHVKPRVDAEEEITHRVQFLTDYLLYSHARGFVLGISGGQDSTLAGKLAQLAVEKLRAVGTDAEFWAMRLPYGVQFDEEDCEIALKFIQPDHTVTVNIKETTDAQAQAVAEALGQEKLTDFNKGNIKARERMIAQYALAGEKKLLVIGTDHAAENVTGFFTKFGDGAADLADARELAAEDEDFAAEVPVLEAAATEAGEHLREVLVPRDPDDARDVIIEVKAGEGGEESALFASDLARMYSRYAERQGWAVEVLDATDSDLGGYKDVRLAIKTRGPVEPQDGVWAHLKYEGGVHRVQRVP
ncbi:MAG: ammonia-dependent NAD(+) synthetase, partial [Corynebacterium matruchotii]